MRLTIRLTGDEKLVRAIGDKIVTLLKSEGFSVSDTGVSESRKEKYRGNYIRYISIE